MSRIFISYRRADSAAYAGRLHDHLSARFGRDLVFMDIDTIQPGEDFVEVLENAVGSSVALVVVIGSDWLTITDKAGVRRLDDPNDFVRIEIATALRRNIRVIPVLVDGASMPKTDQLPDDLKPLHRRNALAVSNERFGYDVGRLIETLERILNPPPVSEPAQPELPPAAAPKVATPAQPVQDMWTQAAPTPQRREPQQEPVAAPQFIPTTHQPASSASGSGATSTSKPQAETLAPELSLTADSKPLGRVLVVLLLMSLGWGIIWALGMDYFSHNYNDGERRTLAVLAVGAFMTTYATAWFRSPLGRPYYVVATIGWVSISWIVGQVFFQSVEAWLNISPEAPLPVQTRDILVMSSLHGSGVIVLALLLWLPRRLYKFWEAIIVIVVWASIWFAGKALLLKFFDGHGVAPFIFGALVGLVGGGVMFYMLRRASQTLQLSAD